MTGDSAAPAIERIPSLIRETAPRVVVVGDLMLDRWWRGGSRRLSREAPAPVVDLVDRTDAPGGAANAAMNLAALGARVRLAGVTGADAAGDRLRQLLAEAGVDVGAVLADAAGTTVTKTRIMADDQIVVRVDDGDRSGPSDDAEERLVSALDAALDDAEAVLVCDYGSALLGGAIRRRLERLRSERPEVLTVVDAHDLAPWAALRPHVVTPNEAEAALLLRRSRAWSGVGTDRIASFTAARDALLSLAGADTVVVTLDREGTVALARDAEPVITRAHPAAEKFASGAGDTFAAALTGAVR